MLSNPDITPGFHHPDATPVRAMSAHGENGEHGAAGAVLPYFARGGN